MEAKIFFHKTCDTQQEPQQKSPNAWLNIPASINAKILQTQELTWKWNRWATGKHKIIVANLISTGKCHCSSGDIATNNTILNKGAMLQNSFIRYQSLLNKRWLNDTSQSCHVVMKSIFGINESDFAVTIKLHSNLNATITSPDNDYLTGVFWRSWWWVPHDITCEHKKHSREACGSLMYQKFNTVTL